MKKIELLCVGKIKEAYFSEALKEYGKRLSRFCSFTVTELADMPDSPCAAKAESDTVLSKLDGYKILLDLKGRTVTSEGFAKTMDSAFTNGACKVQVIIGGSHGVTDSVRAACDAVFNFGAVTYPHQLMRVIAAEQIYRAMCILNGVKYHK